MGDKCPVCGCPTHAAPQTWQVECIKCHLLKWPYCVKKPQRYVCVLCVSGASEGHREAGRRGAKAKWLKAHPA